MLDTQAAVASFGSYLAEITSEFLSRQQACKQFMRGELKKRSYHVR